MSPGFMSPGPAWKTSNALDEEREEERIEKEQRNGGRAGVRRKGSRILDRGATEGDRR